MSARRPTFALLVQVLALLAAGVLARAPALARRPGRAALTIPRASSGVARTRLDPALVADEARVPYRDGAGHAPGLPAADESSRVPAPRSVRLPVPQPRLAHRARAAARKPAARGPPPPA